MSNTIFSVTPSVSGSQIVTNAFNGGNPYPISSQLVLALKNGTAADLCDLISATTYTFVASTPQTANIQALLDAFGATTVFARARFVLFKLYGPTADGATLTIGNAGSNPWTGILGSTSTMTMQAPSATNPNGSFFMFSAPNTTGFLAGASNKNLLMTPNANAFSLDLIIAGSSA